jgi:hypothetical protein
MESAQLEILADKLAAAFPAADDAPLARALLGELAAGAPVTLAQLCAATRGRADAARPSGLRRGDSLAT